MFRAVNKREEGEEGECRCDGEPPERARNLARVFFESVKYHMLNIILCPTLPWRGKTALLLYAAHREEGLVGECRRVRIGVGIPVGLRIGVVSPEFNFVVPYLGDKSFSFFVGLVHP